MQMINPNVVSGWQQALRNVVTDPKELCKILDLNSTSVPLIQQNHNEFTLRVPHAFIARMEKGNPDDPLLKQVLSVQDELKITPGYSNDPLGEQSANPIPGLLHKYQGRVLLILTGGCAVHCRYCFRRHFSYAENAPDLAGWEKVLEYIRGDTSIREVIYSGGDPLLLKDKPLADLTRKIAEIPHVHTLRLHTRLPIVIPERITPEMLTWLTETRLKPVVVVHCNHANEVDVSVKQALSKLQAANVTLLNQSVLLNGINDNVDALVNLSERLFDAGVLPYYLHLLDRVQGAAHFAVPLPHAKQLLMQMTNKLPGYLIPKLVREEAAASAKVAL